MSDTPNPPDDSGLGPDDINPPDGVEPLPIFVVSSFSFRVSQSADS